MKIVIGALCGLIWGAAAALLNFAISKRSIMKNNTTALMGASIGRIAVDFAALGLVFLLRKALPFPFEVTMVATAIAMSLVTIVCAYRLSAAIKPKATPQNKEEQKNEPCDGARPGR